MKSTTTVFSKGKEYKVTFPESEAAEVFGLIGLYSEEIHSADTLAEYLQSLFAKEGITATCEAAQADAA